MCKELTEERERGLQAAQALATHLHNMGAAECTIPVRLDGEEYVVKVTFVPPEEAE